MIKCGGGQTYLRECENKWTRTVYGRYVPILLYMHIVVHSGTYKYIEEVIDYSTLLIIYSIVKSVYSTNTTYFHRVLI